MRQFVWSNWHSDVSLVCAQDITDIADASGALWRTPSRVLVQLPSYRVIALGDDARAVEHAGVGESRVINPYSSSQIWDENAAQVLIRSLLRRTLGTRFLLKPRVLLSLPAQTTPFMRELWQYVLYNAGAREVVPINPLLAIAAGSGLPLYESHGYAVASLTDEGLSLGVVAFGHVQYPHWRAWPTARLTHPRADRADRTEPNRPDDWSQLGAVFSAVWDELLADIPLEFVAALQHEGCLVAGEELETAQVQLLAKAIGSPVVAVPRTVEVLGLRTVYQERKAELG